ncbi:MAG: IS256 family transposase [Acidobacteria bacterium]|nr:IS256 family transposase [Acidobacteriota bacterium]
MGKLAPITEQFQHFVEDLKESFWGDLYGATKEAWKKFLDAESIRERDRYLGAGWYERSAEPKRDYRNGFYKRDYVTVFGTLRLRIARTRKKNFLPAGLERFQRRAEEVMLLIREAFLRGIGTRQVGRVVAILTGEPISAQTVSNVTRGLDAAVERFRQARLSDEWVYLFLDGVNLKVRRPSGRQCVQMLVAYGVRADGSRQLLGFIRSRGESQAAWEGLLNDLQRRGLVGEKLRMIITDGCAGLAAAMQTVYPNAKHQRCWVHKMRNIAGQARKRDHAAVKAGAQAIYKAENRAKARAAAGRFAWRWRSAYPSMVKQLEKDLPQLLTFFDFPKHLWRKLRTTNAIERIFLEVRRRTRPMVVFVNDPSVDRIVFSIFNRFNEQWRNRTLRLFTQAA